MFLTAEYLAIAMEYAAGGDMYHRVVRCRGLPEDDARWYFQQLVIAIDYCHRMARRCAARAGLPRRACGVCSHFTVPICLMLCV